MTSESITIRPTTLTMQNTNTATSGQTGQSYTRLDLDDINNLRVALKNLENNPSALRPTEMGNRHLRTSWLVRSILYKITCGHWLTTNVRLSQGKCLILFLAVTLWHPNQVKILSMMKLLRRHDALERKLSLA
jgi:hypothetical protein